MTVSRNSLDKGTVSRNSLHRMIVTRTSLNRMTAKRTSKENFLPRQRERERERTFFLSPSQIVRKVNRRLDRLGHIRK